MNAEDETNEDMDNQVFLPTDQDYKITVEKYPRVERVAELSFCLCIAAVSFALEASDLSPRMRPIPFQLLDSSGEYIVNQVYNQEFNGETVSSLNLILLAFFLPLLVQLGLSYFYGKNHVHKSLCVWLSGFGINGIVTDCIKLYAGYLRPIFYEFCEPDEDYEECTSGQDKQMRLSFPSGHSSMSFCGLCILSFYLEQRFGVSKSRNFIYDETSGRLMAGYGGPVRFRRIISLLCYLPVALACFIAASRVADDKHHPADVVGGAFIGASVASLVHSIWYPSWPTIEHVVS